MSDSRWDKFLSKKHQLDEVTETLKGISMSLTKWSRLLPKVQTNKARGTSFLERQATRVSVHNGYEMIHRYNVDLQELIEEFPELQKFECDAESLTEKLRVEGTYGIEHQRLLVKVRTLCLPVYIFLLPCFR